MTRARDLSRAVNNKMTVFKYTATAGQTTFTGADGGGATLAYDPNSMIVTYNGIILESTSEYTATNGTSVVLTTGAEVGAEVNILAFEDVAYSGVVPTSGGTFTGDVTFGGEISTDGAPPASTDSGNVTIKGASTLNWTTHQANVAANATFNSTWKYITSNFATLFTQSSGGFRFYTAASDTAGNNISWNQKVTILNDGKVGIGINTPTAPLHVSGANGELLKVSSSSSGGTDLAVHVDANEVSFRVDPDNNEANSVITYDLDGSEKMRLTDAGKLGVGSTAPYAKFHVEGDSYYGGAKWGTWTETMTTRNGGNQTVRIVEDWTGRWILVGRWSANAASNITSTWSSVRGLSTSTSQSETSAFSADFGETYPTECRFIGATDFTNYYNTRVVDFVHGIPYGRPWELFMSNGDATGMGQVTGTGSAKYGWTARGAYDGFGRWTNPNYQYHRIADVGGGGMIHSQAAFRTPTNNAFNWNATSDAKVTVDGTGLTYSGQDTTLTSGFGSDDGNDNKFFDSWPTLSNNMISSSNFTCAVWVLIKFSGI